MLEFEFKSVEGEVKGNEEKRKKANEIPRGDKVGDMEESAIKVKPHHWKEKDSLENESVHPVL
jgi:hypothetical protein